MKFLELFHMWRDKSQVIVIRDSPSSGCNGVVFLNRASAMDYIARNPPGKYWIYENPSHICTKTVIDENC